MKNVVRISLNLLVFGFPLGILHSCATIEKLPTNGKSNFAFIFCYDGETLTELSSLYSERMDDLASLNKKAIPWSWVSETKNDTYACYFFEKRKVLTKRLHSLAMFPSGDGMPIGIAGVIDTNPRRRQPCADFWITGVSFKKPLDREILFLESETDIPTYLQRQVRKDGGPYEAEFFKNTGQSSSIALVHQEIQERKKVVRVFHVVEGTATELSFPEGLFRVGPSLLVHDPTGSTDITPINGELIVLPDFDGNKYPEFVVDSEAHASLFAIEHNDSGLPSVEFKNFLYFGP